MIGSVFLGRYETIGPLGQGSMGRVLLAVDRLTQRQVVVKVMHDHIASQPRFRQLFEAEIQFMAQLRHRYAAALLDGALNDPLGPCMVMEYIPGQTLESILAVQRRLPVERVGRLLGQLCHVLQTAHDCGIIHRDLKPANLMLVDAGTPQETIRVMDFGLAALHVRPHIPLERFTENGPQYAVGTPCYIAPEHLRGDDVDHRSDLYSVGVMLYEMLTGRLPFDDEDVENILNAHVHQPPPTFAQIGLRGVIRPEIEAVVMHCLAKYSNERPQSAQELAERFSKALGINIWPRLVPGLTPEPVKLSMLNRPLPPNSLPSTDTLNAQDPNSIVHRLDAWMPERIAIIKLRGFVESLDGTILHSEPGLIRVRFGDAAASSSSQRGGLFGWFGRRPSGPPKCDAIEMDLYLFKPKDQTTNKNMVQLTVHFHPLAGHQPISPGQWRECCDVILKQLRGYLMV